MKRGHDAPMPPELPLQGKLAERYSKRRQAVIDSHGDLRTMLQQRKELRESAAGMALDGVASPGGLKAQLNDFEDELFGQRRTVLVAIAECRDLADDIHDALRQTLQDAQQHVQDVFQQIHDSQCEQYGYEPLRDGRVAPNQQNAWLPDFAHRAPASIEARQAVVTMERQQAAFSKWVLESEEFIEHEQAELMRQVSMV